MLWPWQIISKKLSLNFTYRIDFNFDHHKILEEYNIAKNNLSQIEHPSIGIDHDGGWEVVSLYSEGGKARSVAKNLNTKTSPTEIIKYFSYTDMVIKNLLNKYECEPRRIRFSTLKAKKKINWHRDWDESIEFGNSRLHMPLVVNDECENNLCHELYNWKPGSLFYGDYSFPHQIINRGSEDRLHLIIDLKNPKNLFTHIEKFSSEEIKRKKFKKIIIILFNFFYKYPNKFFRLISFKHNQFKIID